MDQPINNLKFLYFSDIHLYHKSPSGRKDDYPTTVLYKLKRIIDIANTSNVDYVLCGGDFFNRNLVSADYTCKVVGVLKRLKAPIYIIVGNHDVRGHNKHTINTSTLGILAKSGVINILDIDIGETLRLNIGGKNVIIEGRGYLPDYDLNNNYDIHEKGDFNVLLTHGMLSPTKLMDEIEHSVIDEIYNPANLTFCGHDHKGFGVVNYNNNTFINIGSIARVDSSEQMKSHDPVVFVFALINDNGNIVARGKKVSIKAQNGNEVFKDKTGASKFIADIQEINSKNSSFNIDNIIDSMTNDLDVKDSVYEYISKSEELMDESLIEDYTRSSEEIYIEEVTLSNFKAHANTTVNLSQGLNIITGENNVGKSTILKAINWVFSDLPKGDSFIRTGQKKAVVTVKFNNGNYIKKTRTKKTASYEVCKNGEILNFKGFGTKLPNELLEIHQSPIVDLHGEKTSINYQGQLDNLFLVGTTPSKRATAIGRLTRTHIYDNSITILTKDIKALNQSIKSKSEPISKLENLIDEKEDEVKLIEDLRNKACIVIEKYKGLSMLRDTITDYMSISSKCNELEKKVNINLPTFTDYSFGRNILEYLHYQNKDTRYNSNLKYIENHTVSLSDFSIVLEYIESTMKYQDSLKELEVLSASNREIKGYDFSYNILAYLVALKNNIECINKVNMSNNTIEDLNYKLNNIDKDIETDNDNLKGTVCPTCGREIN